MRQRAGSRLSAHRRRRGAGLAIGDKVGQQSPMRTFTFSGRWAKIAVVGPAHQFTQQQQRPWDQAQTRRRAEEPGNGETLPDRCRASASHRRHRRHPSVCHTVGPAPRCIVTSVTLTASRTRPSATAGDSRPRVPAPTVQPSGQGHAGGTDAPSPTTTSDRPTRRRPVPPPPGVTWVAG